LNDVAHSVITVGTFDGVHLGHRAVLEEIKERAERSGRRSVLVTFEPHPLEIVNPHAAPPLLTAPSERREALAPCEIDRVVILPFTKSLSQYSPEQFVALLRSRYGMMELVIGHDHGFGRGRAGDVHVLRALGAKHGFGVDVVEPVVQDGKSVSSTLVRRAIAGGDLETARSLLGRPYSFVGDVVAGAGRGKELGYPTINLSLPNARKLLPPDGVYAVWAEWRGGHAGGVMHQGPRPTFEDLGPSVEVHLFGVDEDLYGQMVKVAWVVKLRDIRAYPDVSALKAQIEKDARAARDALTRGWWRAST
jgi:riboflavin kinase/FMN adenylyltransferase